METLVTRVAKQILRGQANRPDILLLALYVGGFSVMILEISEFSVFVATLAWLAMVLFFIANWWKIVAKAM